MKRMAILMLAALMPAFVQAAEEMPMHHAMMHGGTADKGAEPGDQRISLGLPPAMRHNQLAMMRDHLKSVDEIIALIGEEKFDAAAKVAHERLGLTPEMQKMCSMFGNDRFRELGLNFHKSADHLGEVLKQHDTNASLDALHNTMQYCITCHQTFRQ
jgi:cytochrome c556